MITCSTCWETAEPSRHNRNVCLSCHRKYKAKRANIWYHANPERAKAAREKGFINRPSTKMVTAARMRAKARGIEFSIAPDDVVVPSHCPALGIKLERGRLGGHSASPSLDRIDNARGYVKGNVIVVSMKANAIKNNATVSELESVAKFYKNLGAK